MKRSNTLDIDSIFGDEDEEACAECGAEPGHDHATWCLAEADEA